MTRSGIDGQETGTERHRLRPTSLTRYDLVLAVVPTAFVVALLVGRFLSLQPRTTVVGAAIVSALAIADGLFRNPPTRRRGIL